LFYHEPSKWQEKVSIAEKMHKNVVNVDNCQSANNITITIYK